MYVQNYGMIKTKIYKKKGSKTKKQNYKLAWNGDYDGNKANIIIDLNDNGIKQKENITLNNDELMSMFNYPIHPMDLEKRLLYDSESLSESTPKVYIIKNKSRKKNRRHSLRKNKKHRNIIIM